MARENLTHELVGETPQTQRTAPPKGRAPTTAAGKSSSFIGHLLRWVVVQAWWRMHVGAVQRITRRNDGEINCRVRSAVAHLQVRRLTAHRGAVEVVGVGCISEAVQRGGEAGLVCGRVGVCQPPSDGDGFLDRGDALVAPA